MHQRQVTTARRAKTTQAVGARDASASSRASADVENAHQRQGRLHGAQEPHASGRCKGCEREANSKDRRGEPCTNGRDGCKARKNHTSGRCKGCEREANNKRPAWRAVHQRQGRLHGAQERKRSVRSMRARVQGRAPTWRAAHQRQGRLHGAQEPRKRSVQGMRARVHNGSAQRRVRRAWLHEGCRRWRHEGTVYSSRRRLQVRRRGRARGRT